MFLLKKKKSKLERPNCPYLGIRRRKSFLCHSVSAIEASVTHSPETPSWLPQHIKSIDAHFLEWFIGFTEGDGSFIVSNYKAKDGSNAPNPRHMFMINQKDPQVLYKIRKNLGFGTIKPYDDKKQGTSYFRYVISDLDGIERLIQIFNGRLVLNKTQERFKLWVDAYNARPSISGVHSVVSSNSRRGKTQDLLNFPILSKSLLSLDTAWFSGFIDAEGCFCSRFNKKKNTLHLDFSLSQKNEKPSLELIQKMFPSGSLCPYKHPTNYHVYTLSVSKVFVPIPKKSPEKIKDMEFKRKSCVNKLLNYLDKFALKSEKIINYIRYKKLLIRLNDLIDREPGTKRQKRLERLIKTLEK
jgi:hypothetical protein